MNEPPFVYLAVGLVWEVWWLDWLLIVVEAWGIKIVSARLPLQVSLYEPGPILYWVKLLELRRKGREHIGFVLIELTGFVALHPPPCCVGLVSKKDDFLADGIDLMQNDLSSDGQTKTWFFEKLEDTVSNPRNPCCFVTPNLPPCLEPGKVFSWNSYVSSQISFDKAIIVWFTVPPSFIK